MSVITAIGTKVLARWNSLNSSMQPHANLAGRLFGTAKHMHNQKSSSGSTQRRGGALIYVLIGFTTFCAFASLGVDLARVQVVKTELQNAVDAAALAAARDLANGTTSAQATAIAVAAQNKADEQSVVLTASTDIEFGTWNSSSKTFTVLTGSAASSANAVRITARRTTATGNPIPLTFAQMIGQRTCNATARAIGYRTPSSGGYIGISLTRMYNTARFDGYWSTKGAYSASSAVQGTLLSFKDMWLYDNSTVYGEAHWDNTGIFNHDSTAIVSPGPCTPENLNSNFPAASAGSYATTNDNANLTNYYSSNQLVIPDNQGTITYPGGNYYFTKFDCGKGNTVKFSGPTVIYLKCGGKFECTIQPSSLYAGDLAIKVLPTYNWTIDAGADFTGSFYNPTGDVHHHNGGISRGSVISDLLCFRQTSEGHHDLSLGKYATAAGVSLVK